MFPPRSRGRDAQCRGRVSPQTQRGTTRPPEWGVLTVPNEVGVTGFETPATRESASWARGAQRRGPADAATGRGCVTPQTQRGTTRPPEWGVLTVPNEVGVTGFEPAASCSRSKRSTKLSYTPQHPRSETERRVVENTSDPPASQVRLRRTPVCQPLQPSQAESDFGSGRNPRPLGGGSLSAAP